MSSKRTINWLVALALFSAALLPGSSASAQPVTSVHITGQATGYLPRPCNCSVDLIIAVDALGTPELLEGSGVNHATTGATNLYSVTGSTSDGIVLLTGVIHRSTGPITDSPIAIEADANTGELTFVLGPIIGGPFVGQTIEFTGSGNTIIVGG